MKRSTAITLVLGFGASACSKSTGGGVGGRVNSWTQPHVLRYATAEDINTLNPHLGQQETLGLLSSLTMAWLIKWDERNLPYPELVTEVPTQSNGGVSEDGLTITYHLRRGVRWSDGAPFTAADVVFSTRVVLNPKNNEISTQGWNLIDRIEQPDEYTVRYHLKKPYSPFIETFFSSSGANPCILPKHLLARYASINNVPYNSLPVGIGPFKYQSWERSQQVVMVADPFYWRGMPKLHEINFKIIPDRNTVMSELQANELDMWYPATGSFLPQIEQLRGFRLIRKPSYAYDHLDFDVTRPAVSDPVVRRALRLAINRQEIIDKVAHGVGILQDTPTPRTAPYYVPAPIVPFDIPQANALLDAAGWARGSDGVRAKNGVRLVLQFATSTGTPDVDTENELIRSWWKQIGVGMNVRPYTSPQLFAPLESGGIIYGTSWDVVGFAWFNDAIGDYSPIYAGWNVPPAGQNDPRWRNAKADGAMAALWTHFDQAQRTRDDVVLVQQLNDDVPTIIMSLSESLWVMNADLKNFHPNSVAPFDNVMDADI